MLRGVTGQGRFLTLMILAVNKSADEVKEPLSVDEYRVFFYFIHTQYNLSDRVAFFSVITGADMSTEGKYILRNFVQRL